MRARLEHKLKLEAAESTFSRIIAEMDGRALLNNYRAILEQVPSHHILPMIKANGYGHGLVWTAKQLVHSPALYGFGVATLQEGEQLRQGLGLKFRKTKIIVFSGATPWSDEKGAFCEENGLTPVISSEADWHSFVGQGWTSRVSYELQFNTGMNRLGIPSSYAVALARTLRSKPADEHPSGVFTHLAMAEEPDSKLSKQQADRFRAIRSELGIALPQTFFHLANSACIWNQKAWGLKDFTDIVRPGLALYGVPPWAGAPARGIVPVMAVKAQVVSIHRLKPGESIGYGGTYRVPSEGPPVRAAILAAGYADGVFRRWSNRGYAYISGSEQRFLGNVSMDLCAVSCPESTAVGDWAELLGPDLDLWAQAKAAETIPYELLTSVSGRVQRRYV